MIDTAGTITEAINVLTNAGAKKVGRCKPPTHPSSDPASKRLSESGAAEAVTDTRRSLLRSFLGAASSPRLSRRPGAIHEVFEDGSVTRCLTDGFLRLIRLVVRYPCRLLLARADPYPPLSIGLELMRCASFTLPTPTPT